MFLYSVFSLFFLLVYKKIIGKTSTRWKRQKRLEAVLVITFRRLFFINDSLRRYLRSPKIEFQKF